MKLFLLLIAVGSSCLEAGDFPVNYPSRLKGFFIEGVASRKKVTLSTGNLSRCEEFTSGDWGLHKCEVENSYALIERDGQQPLYIVFERSLTERSTLHKYEGKKKVPFRRFNFQGEYSENVRGVRFKSEVQVVFREYGTDLGNFRGYLEFIDYNHKVPIQLVFDTNP